MNISFQISPRDIESFLGHWSSRYRYDNEHLYTRNIGNPLTKRSLLELFEWKNGRRISRLKSRSIETNYPLQFRGEPRERYLDHRQPGGAIWNIFYLHCLQPETWPIFDQHTFRAMRYMRTGAIVEIGPTNKQKYDAYLTEYIPFLREFGTTQPRTVDKALFTYGQFLKIAKKYV